MRGRFALLTTTLFLALAPRLAGAAEITDVASAFDEDNPFDFRLRVGYSHWEKRAAIKRELELSGAKDIGLYKDLLYQQSRDSLHLRMEVSVFQDLMVYGELPIVLGDSREYRFDQSAGSGCIYPNGMENQMPPPNCVNASNSTTVRDNVVPMGGFDATNRGAMFPDGSALLFRGPNRGGSGLDAFDTINLGITWGVLSQKRDDTKPTWTINFEGQVSIGNVMKFDRAQPDGNKGVSDGLHKLMFRTAVSKRFQFVDPYIGFWYMLPLARTDSLFIDYGPTQKNRDPQMAAGTVFGIEMIPWERPDKQYKVALQLQGRIEAKFDGRGYSEAWEMFASSDAMRCDPAYNPACDPMQTTNPYQNKPFTGLTTIENHAVLGADAGLVVQAGKYVRFHAGFQYTHNQSHFITIDDVGRALQMDCKTPVAGGRVSRACEFNPAYRAVVNQVGRRYKVDNVDIYNFFVYGQVMF